MDIAADGADINTSVENIGEVDHPAHGLHVDSAIFHVANVYYRICPFERQVSLQVLGRQRTGRRMKIEDSVRRNEQLVVDLATLPAGALQDVGCDINAIAVLLLIDFDV